MHLFLIKHSINKTMIYHWNHRLYIVSYIATFQVIKLRTEAANGQSAQNMYTAEIVKCQNKRLKLPLIKCTYFITVLHSDFQLITFQDDQSS